MSHSNHIVYRPSWSAMTQAAEAIVLRAERDYWRGEAEKLAAAMEDLIDAACGGGRIMLCQPGKVVYVIADPDQELSPGSAAATGDENETA